jgi:hypothetical protein
MTGQTVEFFLDPFDLGPAGLAHAKFELPAPASSCRPACRARVLAGK